MADYRAIARRKARKYGLNPAIFERQIAAESGFNPRARSPAGAQGIAQIMPATARGWGVNPMDPEAALDAAAKNMARYVKQYGSYENALRAYNAGPAAIQKSKGYRETNAYVAKILRGGSPSTSGVSGGGSTSSRTVKVPGIDTREVSRFDESGFKDARRKFLLGSMIARRNPRSFLVRSGLLTTTEPSKADFVKTELQSTPTVAGTYTVPGASRQRGAKVGRVNGSPLYEMFYNGPGGINVDNGKRVPKGFVSGHTGHVHVAAGPKTIRRMGKLAQEMGLTVGENKYFTGRTPTGGHAPKSFHYRNMAIDVTGDPRKLREFNRRVAKMYGIG